jgi:hypothetical protein
LNEIKGEIEPDHIIASSQWLADPVPEHYYGPGRIY